MPGVRGRYAGCCQCAVSVARCVQLYGAFFSPCPGARLGKGSEPYKGNNGQRAKKFSAGAGRLAAQAAAQTAAQLSWLAALLRSVNALKKRMYVTYIRFLQKLSQSSARTRRRNRMVVRQTAIRISGGGGVGEETLLQKGPSPTKHFKKKHQPVPASV